MSGLDDTWKIDPKDLQCQMVDGLPVTLGEGAIFTLSWNYSYFALHMYDVLHNHNIWHAKKKILLSIVLTNTANTAPLFLHWGMRQPCSFQSCLNVIYMI